MSYTPADFKQLLERIRKKRTNVKSVLVTVYHKPTSRTVKKIERWTRTGGGERKEPILKDVVVTRTGRENGMIAAIQKHSFKRNPFFTKAGERTKIQRMFRAAIEQIMGDKRIGLDKAAQQIGKAFASIYRDHILKEINSRGAMTKLKKSYAVRKNMRHGRKLPILVDSGSLLASIAFRIKEVS